MKDDEKRDEQDVTNLIERVVSDPMRGRMQSRYSLLPPVFLSVRVYVCFMFRRNYVWKYFSVTSISNRDSNLCCSEKIMTVSDAVSCRF